MLQRRRQPYSRATLLAGGGAATALLVSAAMFPSAVWANGFEMPENGTRAIGRGGAYAASVAEPSALYFNPAALTRTRSTAVTFNLNLVDDHVRFERESYQYYAGTLQVPINERIINFSAVEDQEPPFPAPMVFAASRFGLQDWAFGVGIYGPSAMGNKEFPAMSVRPPGYDGEVTGVYTPGPNRPITRDGGQAYMANSYNLLLFYPSIAASYQIPRANLSVGITAQLAVLDVTYDVGVDGLFGRGSENEVSREADDLYATTVLDVRGYAFTGIVGLLWDPIPALSVGLSYRPRFRIDASGEVDISFPPALLAQEPRVDDNGAELTTWMPDIVRAGVQYRHLNAAGRELFDIEANVVYEGWSVNEGFDVRLAGRLTDNTETVKDQKLPDLFLRRNYRDVVSVRLGGDLSLLRNPETGNGPVFRLGGYWESNASPEEWTNIDFIAFERFGGALGFSYHIGRWSIDAAYAYVFSPERTVTNGQYDLLVPTWICEDPPADVAEACAQVEGTPGHPVNNGTYNWWAQTFSLGFTWGW